MMKMAIRVTPLTVKGFHPILIICPPTRMKYTEDNKIEAKKVVRFSVKPKYHDRLEVLHKKAIKNKIVELSNLEI
jgi:hypothetical protein